MAVARREVGAGLRDADDRLAGRQLLEREAVIEVALEIERGHAGIFRIVEPQLRAQLAAFRHRRLVVRRGRRFSIFLRHDVLSYGLACVRRRANSDSAYEVRRIKAFFLARDQPFVFGAILRDASLTRRPSG